MGMLTPVMLFADSLARKKTMSCARLTELSLGLLTLSCTGAGSWWHPVGVTRGVHGQAETRNRVS